MPFQVADRVKESSTTTGTGAITLAGALTGFRAFSSVCSVGDTCYYALQQVDANGNPSGVWETGIGTYSATNTLTRTTVFSSSNSNAAVTLAGTTHVWIDAPAVAMQTVSNRNQFVDGNFDSWQVGTSFTLGAAVDQYTADMWRTTSGTGGATTVSRLTAVPEAAPAWINSGRRYKLRFAQTTSASSAPQLYQNIEGVGTFSGRSVTVSASLVAAAAATLVTGVQIVQNFGSGGSPSSSVVTLKNVTWAVGTTEARFSVRVDVPSIAAKTLGTNGDDKLQVAFILATGITFTLDFSQLQIEESSPSSSGDTTGSGGAPTPFEYRGLPLELGRVKRFIERIDGAGGNIKYYAYNISGNYGLLTVTWSTQKQRSPTTTIGGTWVGTSGVVNTPFVDAANAFVGRIAAQWSTTGSGSFDSGSNGYILADARL